MGAVLVDGGGGEAVADCVVGVVFELEVLRQGAKFVVWRFRDYFACQFDGVDDGVFGNLDAFDVVEGVEETHVEASVMGDDGQVADEFEELVDFVLDDRRPLDHFVCDACEPGDGYRYVTFRIDECIEDFDPLMVDVFECPNLDDTVSASTETCCFEVEHDIVCDVPGCRFVFPNSGSAAGPPVLDVRFGLQQVCGFLIRAHLGCTSFTFSLFQFYYYITPFLKY